MKLIIKLFLFSVLVFLGIKFLLPYEDYPIEHFEQFLYKLGVFNWKSVAILSRILVGLIFVLAFFIVLKNLKYKKLHYISFIAVIIPFIINPVLLEHFSDKVEPTNIELPYVLESNEKQLVIYLSSDCYHCKEALIKLNVASKKNKLPLKIVAISYNNEIKNYLLENNMDFEFQVINAKVFTEETALSFPKFALIDNNKIIKKWTNPEFNYAVLDELFR